MNDLSKARATQLEVGEEGVAQRIDNFLLRRLKGVPKSHVYRVLRSGEVRVNSARVRPDYRLQAGDRVRIPPVRVADARRAPLPPKLPALPVVYEDDALMVVDKPSGVAVHGGSGLSYGAIEALRAARPASRTLALAHRLDRDTSGLLMIAKKRTALTALHAMLREGRIDKRYWAIVHGRWTGGTRELRDRLHKYVTAHGERRVAVHGQGQEALTRVRPIAVAKGCSLLELQLLTGRTHQIRVHLAHCGHPVLGDDKYGNAALDRAWAEAAAKRLFLHAARLTFEHPVTGVRMKLSAPMPAEMRRFAEAQLALRPDRL
jgi:23S rRNA pseudouridine955/2504/2580 synthase